jgi:protein involved in polysaccharide export with SLBB domain
MYVWRYVAWLSLVLLSLMEVLTGCGAPIGVPELKPEEISRVEASGNYPHQNYRIEPGDTLRIKYTFHPEMDQQGMVVRPDGKITATLVGEIEVADLTTTELEKLLVKRTSDRLRDPEVIVTVDKFAEKQVYVGGEVRKPGTIPYRKDLTPLQAVIAAGGFESSARLDSVILVRKGKGNNPEDFIARKLDLKEVVTNGADEPIFLAPHDVVFVPRTPIANANLWVRQYITDLFLVGFRPITPFAR